MAVFFFTSTGWAITNCFDYVAYRLSPTCQELTDASGKPVHRILYDTMKVRLLQLGYKYYDAAGLSPDVVQKQLKPGTVIIINHSHVAIVNESGGIDHFLQTFLGNGGMPVDYSPDKLPGKTANPHGTEGGLFRDETYQELLRHRGSLPAANSVEVWVRGQSALPYKDCPQAVQGGSSANGPCAGRSASLDVSNTKPVKVKTPFSTSPNCDYLIEASGDVSDWSDKSGGVDPVWCFAEWRCGKKGEPWQQLRIDGQGMAELAGHTLDYNSSHTYKIKIRGTGKPLEFWAADAQGSSGDNKGAFKVRITEVPRK
jgi:hypothetical protein